MDVAQSRKVGKHLSETFRDGLLGEFDLAHVEITDAGDFVARMDDRGRAALSASQDNVHEVRGAGHRGHGFEVVDGHDEGLKDDDISLECPTWNDENEIYLCKIFQYSLLASHEKSVGWLGARPRPRPDSNLPPNSKFQIPNEEMTQQQINNLIRRSERERVCREYSSSPIQLFFYIIMRHHRSTILLSFSFAVGTVAAWTALLPLSPASMTSLTHHHRGASPVVSPLAARKRLPLLFERDEELPAVVDRRDFFQSTAAKAAKISLLVAASSTLSPLSPSFVSPAIANAASDIATTNTPTANNPYFKVYQPPPHSMDGKLVLVTGGNAGLGLESTKRLVAAGATVVFTSRDEAKGKQALEEINEYLRKQEPQQDDDAATIPFRGKVLMTTLDLCDLENVKSFKDRFVNALGGGGEIKIDVLMNNAGVMAIPDKRLTKDGYEKTFQTNHLGHFALTSTLLPLLAKDSRIVNVSSLAYMIASKNGLEIDNLNGEKDYGPWSSYGQSKLENILFTNELQRRLQNSEKYSKNKIMAFSLHPGAVQTDLARYIIGEEKFQSMKENGFGSWQEKFLMEGLSKFIKTVQEGASTQIYLAASSNIRPNEAGLFFNDGKVMPLPGFATDTTKAEELWTVSEKLSGVKFDL